MESIIKSVRNFHAGCREITQRLSEQTETTRKSDVGYEWHKVRQEIGGNAFTFRKFIRYIAGDEITFDRFWRMPSSEFLFELSIFVERKMAEKKARQSNK